MDRGGADEGRADRRHPATSGCRGGRAELCGRLRPVAAADDGPQAGGLLTQSPDRSHPPLHEAARPLSRRHRTG